MIGAAATLAGVTRTTVSLAVIVFELTGTYRPSVNVESISLKLLVSTIGTLTYSLPTMFAVLVAKTVADAIEPRSICEMSSLLVTFSETIS